MKRQFRIVVDIDAVADTDSEHATNIREALATIERALTDDAFEIIAIRRQRCAGEAQ